MLWNSLSITHRKEENYRKNRFYSTSLAARLNATSLSSATKTLHTNDLWLPFATITILLIRSPLQCRRCKFDGLIFVKLSVNDDRSRGHRETMIWRQINGKNLLKRGEKRKRGWRTSRSSANDLTRKTNVIHGRKVRSSVRGFSRFIAAIRLSEFQLKRPKCPARNTGGNNFQRNTGRAPASEQRWKASHEYDWHRAISWRSTRATRSGKKRIGRKKRAGAWPGPMWKNRGERWTKTAL